MSKNEPPTPPKAKAASPKQMSEAQRAYESRRASKAGVSLDKHLAAKQRRAEQDKQKAAPLTPAKKPGIVSRLLERARRPL